MLLNICQENSQTLSMQAINDTSVHRLSVHRLMILFVEGEVLARNIIRTFLQQNYDILIAANGNEALEISRRYRGSIHILLIDEELQFGSSPLQWLIGAERPGIRIVPISGDSRVGPSAGLCKPFQLGVLHDRLRESLDRHKTEYRGVILVADDDRVRRERIRQILIGDGYSVLTAHSSAEADTIVNGISGIALVIDSKLINDLPNPLAPATLLSSVRRLLELKMATG
jgi:CheY-like chemotaxis protein